MKTNLNFKLHIVCFFLIIFIGMANFCLAEQIGLHDQNVEYTGEFTYQIGPGDTIEISVWRHPDLNMKVMVRPDCRISFPLIDEVNVRDLTPEALKKELQNRLARVIRDPEVTVNVIGFESKKIFVLGEVNQPGVYPFEGRIRVLDALSKAGGYKDETAALKSVLVIRNGYSSKPQVIRVNILNLIKNGNPGGNILLAPDDIVFVSKTFISDVNKFIDQFFNKTDPVLKYYLDIYNIRKPGVLGTI